MAFTTTYTFQHVTDISITGIATPSPGTFVDPDLTEFGGGAFLTYNDWTSGLNVDGREINSAGTVDSPFAVTTSGGGPASDVLTNGNIVTTFQVGFNGFFQLTNGVTGAPIGMPVAVGGDNQEIDVAALSGGGFVVARSTEASGDRDTFVSIYNASGTLVNSFEVTAGSPTTTDEQDIVVTGLNDGGFAVAWTRLEGTNEVYTAVYEANGTERSAPQLVTSAMGLTGHSPDIVSLSNGHYAILHVANRTTESDSDIQYARFNASGTQFVNDRLFNSTLNQLAPSVSVGDNGIALVAFEVPFGAASDTAVVAFSQFGGTPLTDTSIGVSADDEINPTIAALSKGRLLVLHDNKTDATIEGEVNQLVATIVGDGADDIINGFAGIDIVRSGGGDDVVRGGNSDDTIRGEGGLDRLLGDGGADRLFGDNGKDTIRGGAGNDEITGGRGKDILFGEGGKDEFIYKNKNESGTTSAKRDKIKDFSGSNSEDINLKAIDANSKKSGNQKFNFIGQDEFSGSGNAESKDAAQLRYEKKSANRLIVEADINGDGEADMTIEVLGVGSLQAGDFIL